MASSKRSSRSSSSSNLNSTPAAGQHGSSERLSEFDLGSFTFITDDDLDFEQAGKSDHPQQGGHGQTAPPHAQSRALPAQNSHSHRSLSGHRERGGGRGGRIASAGARQADNVRNKLQAAWNKVRYGWMVKSRASFTGNAPVVLLGNVYIGHELPAASDCSDDDEQPGTDPNYSWPGADSSATVAGADLKAFYIDFESRIWITYRRDFPRIADSPFTTDCGWGCMLRCGQMALAQGLIVHFLGRGWRRPMASRRRSSADKSSYLGGSGRTGSYAVTSTRHGGVTSAAPTGTRTKAAAAAVPSESTGDRQADFRYRFIVSCMMDSPSAHSPFSLHRLVQLGSHYGKKAGDWFGPGSTAHILQDAVARSSLMYPVFGDICVYVAHDCTIYKQDVVDLCRQQRRPSTSVVHRIQHSAVNGREVTEAGGPRETINGRKAPTSTTTVTDASLGSTWKSVIIFVPMRLGGEKLNELYVQCLQGLLSLEHCIGIMGGRPRHSLYFVGFQDAQLIYLDPHLCQDSLDAALIEDTGHLDTSSYHCRTPRKLAFSDMDPSCTIGFYCRDEADFTRFLDSIKPYLVLPGQRSRYPLFIINEGTLHAATFHGRASATTSAAAAATAAGKAAARLAGSGSQK